MILIQDDEQVFNTVNHPAVVFDSSCGTLYKIGEYDVMYTYFKDTVEKYRTHGFHDMADDLVLMTLPQDQTLVDKVFNNTGYILTIYNHLTK